jgi:hypothetical protein
MIDPHLQLFSHLLEAIALDHHIVHQVLRRLLLWSHAVLQKVPQRSQRGQRRRDLQVNRQYDCAHNTPH